MYLSDEESIDRGFLDKLRKYCGAFFPGIIVDIRNLKDAMTEEEILSGDVGRKSRKSSKNFQ